MGAQLHDEKGQVLDLCVISIKDSSGDTFLAASLLVLIHLLGDPCLPLQRTVGGAYLGEMYF